MRALRFLNITILSLLVGSAALVYAQDEKQQDEKPARQEDAKPQPKQDEAKPNRQNEAKPQNQDNKQMDKQDQKRGQEQSGGEAKPQEARPQGQGQERPDAQGDRNRQGQDRQQMQGGGGARPSGRGGHIPDDKFRASFGHGHHFNAKTVIVQGQPQFQYGGYTFEFVDAWPPDWAYTDDCYVDYIDGEYFLFDLMHPGVRIALFVVM